MKNDTIEPSAGSRSFAQCMPRSKRGVSSQHAPYVEQLVVLGRKALKAQKAFKGRYLAICLHIRKHQIAPRLVTQALTEAGFSKERVSEIKRVSFVSKEIWDMFNADLVGFRPMLRKVRELDKGKTTKSALLVKWRRLFASFSSLTMSSTEPPESHFSANGHHLVVWSDTQKSKRKFTVGNWLVTVTKNETKTEPKNDSKNTHQK